MSPRLRTLAGSLPTHSRYSERHRVENNFGRLFVTHSSHTDTPPPQRNSSRPFRIRTPDTWMVKRRSGGTWNESILL